MKEYLKRVKADFMFSSALCVLLGIIIVIYRGGVINLLGRMIAVLMITIGVLYLGSFLLSLATNGFSVIVGILVLAAGIWVLSHPAEIISLGPVIIGVLLLFHGIRAVMETITAKKHGYESWGVNIVLALICILSGFICIFDAFHVVENAIVLVGIILIFNGLANIWIAAAAARAAREYDRRNGTIDVEFAEDEKENK